MSPSSFCSHLHSRFRTTNAEASDLFFIGVLLATGSRYLPTSSGLSRMRDPIQDLAARVRRLALKGPEVHDFAPPLSERSVIAFERRARVALQQIQSPAMHLRFLLPSAALLVACTPAPSATALHPSATVSGDVADAGGPPTIVEPSGRVPALGYQVAPGFLHYPPDWVQGEASGVAVSSRGHIYLFQRAKPMLSEFDENGRFVRSLGEGLFDHPHGLRIDRDDNLWTTDDGNHTVLKLSPDGHVLLVLGKRDMGGEADWLFNKPTDVAFGARGEIFVADGYGNSRIMKFDRDGNFILAWGRYGSAPGQFVLPHSVAVDRGGRVYVGDRENGRIQLFDGDGKFLEQWTGIGYPYGLLITADQHVWMADGGFDRIVELDPAGKIVGAFGAPGRTPGQFAWAHFLAVTPDRKLIVADVLNWRFQVFTPGAPSAGVADYVPTRRMFYGFRESDGFINRAAGWPAPAR